jgi:hypothetical protein
MTTSTDYHRTVTAALSETASKFALAEALALDIAPRRGRPGRDEVGTDQQLAEVREQIIEAGGEPRSVVTLRNYRLTALWVKHPKTGAFRWLKGRCWSAHDEARQRGLSYAEFTALPADTRVEDVRDIFRESPAYPQEDHSVPVTFLSPAGDTPEVVQLSLPKAKPERRPVPAPRPAPEPKRLNLVVAFRSVHRSVEQIAGEVAAHGIEPGEKDMLLQEVTWLTVTLTQIRKDIRAGNLASV